MISLIMLSKAHFHFLFESTHFWRLRICSYYMCVLRKTKTIVLARFTDQLKAAK